MHKISNFLTNAAFTLLIILVIGIPFAFLPFLENFFDTPKFLLLFVAAFFSFLFWARQVLAEKQLRISTHAFLLPILLLTIAVVLSAFLSNDTLFNSFWSLNGMLVLSGLIIIFLSTVLTTIRINVLKEILLSVGIVTALVGFLQAVGIGPSSILNTFLTVKLNPDFRFAFTGSPLASLTLLILTFVLGLTSLMKTRNWKSSVFDIASVILIGLGIGLHVFMMLPGKIASPILLPFSAQWLLFADFIKVPLRLLVGYGPNGFSDAFTVLRPVQLNASPLWNVVFQSGSNGVFTLAFTSGLLALVAWIAWFGIALFQLPKAYKHDYFPFAATVVALFVLHLFIPFNAISLLILTVCSTVWIVGKKESGNQLFELIFHPKMLIHRLGERSEHSSHVFVFVVISCLGVLLLFPIWMVIKLLVGEYFVYKSSAAYQANDGKAAYENIQKAVSWNPYNPAYRLAYSKTNFLIAQNLSQKENITDEERNNIAQLMQQAVRESRNAAQLNPVRSQNWRSMAEIYRSLVGSVKDAESFTYAAYAQAIQLSPTDPSLRVDLGSLFLQQKNYEQAQQFFEQSIQLKPDYPDGYFSLGQALELQNKFEPAVAAYKQTLRLLEANSDPENQQQQDQITQLKKIIETAEEKLATEQKKAPEKQVTTQSVSPTPTPTATPLPEQPQEVDTPAEGESKDELLKNEPEIPASSSANTTE